MFYMRTTDIRYPNNSDQPAESNGVQSKDASPIKSTISLDKIELWIVLGIFLLGLCVRYFYLYESSDNPTFEAPISDSLTYHGLAQQLAKSKHITDDFFWQPLFYPLFLGAVYYFSNVAIIAAKSVQIILGGSTCILSYFLAKRIFGRRTGILAAIMVAFYVPLIFYETELLATGWASFWSLALILLFLKAGDTKRLSVCFLLGVCGAMSIITRPTFLPFFAASCLWLVFILYCSSMPKKNFVLSPVVILTGFALISVPVAYRCYCLTGHFGILPPSGGINLYIGNNPNSVETMNIRPGADWEELINMPVLCGMGESRWVRQRFFHQKVREYILGQPFDFVKGLARKTLRFFSSREIPRGINIYTFRRWSGLLTFGIWSAGGFGFPFGLLLPLAIFGLIFGRRQIPIFVILFIFFYAVSIILVFVSSRYRMPLVPVMCCLGAGGIAAVYKMIRQHQSKRLTITAGCIIGIALLCSLAGPFPEESVNYEAELYYGLGSNALQSGEFDRAAGYYREAIEQNPDFAGAYNNLGFILLQMDELERAVPLLEKALQLRPKYIKAHGNISRVFMKQGNPSAAIEYLEEALALAPRSKILLKDLAKAHFCQGKALTEQGKIEEAIESYHQALRLRANWPEVLNSLARIYATYKDHKLRDGPTAVQLAQRACELTDYKNPRILDTLAAAYAEAGRFSEAVKTAEKALKLAVLSGQKDLIEEIHDCLEIYKESKICR